MPWTWARSWSADCKISAGLLTSATPGFCCVHVIVRMWETATTRRFAWLQDRRTHILDGICQRQLYGCNINVWFVSRIILPIFGFEAVNLKRKAKWKRTGDTCRGRGSFQRCTQQLLIKVLSHSFFHETTVNVHYTTINSARGSSVKLAYADNFEETNYYRQNYKIICLIETKRKQQEILLFNSEGF